MDDSIRPLKLRTDYFHDRHAFLALASLLRDIFGIDISLLDRFGGPNPTSMPFGYFDPSGRCVANFSAFSMPLVIDGKPVRAVGYQSGAVRPDYRGRGLYRDLMRRAFAWADAGQFELGILLTDKPVLYEPHGFRIVPQHRFQGPAPAGASLHAPDCRLLSLADASDIALLRRLLAGRMPVSARLAVADQSTEFPLNACFDPAIRLAYLPPEDVVVAWAEEADGFHLLDIVGSAILPLAVILGRLGKRVAALTVSFPPERLGWDGAEPVPYTGSCELMVRPMSADVAFPSPAMLSPMADF